MSAHDDYILALLQKIKGGFSAPGALRWAEKSTDATVLYLAEAAAGTLDASAGWRVSEIATGSGTIKWADQGKYTQVWNDREALTYL